MRLAFVALCLLGACGKTDAPREQPLGPPSVVFEDWPPPSMGISQFLGLPRSANEGLLGTKKNGTNDGWVDYGSWQLRYAAGCCVGLRTRRPQNLECRHAINVVGFAPVETTMRPGACEWTTPTEHGKYDPKTGLLDVERTDKPPACQER